MDRRNTFGSTLVVLALVLFAVPAVFPIQPMLYHDTGRIVHEPPETLEQENVDIVAYENLSDRGQALYVKTLENDGEYRVPVGDGAPEFTYLNDSERREAYQTDNQTALQDLVIERPAEDGDLPPADERYFGPGPDEGDLNESEYEQRRELAMRYDAMETRTSEPPLGATPQLLRLGSVLVAVLFLGIGGYLLSSK